MDFDFQTNQLIDALVSSLVFLFWGVIFLGILFTLYDWFFVEPLPSTVMAAPTDCMLVQSLPVEGGTLVEEKAGAYRYEAYVTVNGIEIYKCNN